LLKLIPGRDDGGDLLERGTQLELFRWRHDHVLAGVARRLKRGIDAGREPFEVLLDCQDHVLTAASSWVDLVVLEAFADAVERSGEPVLDRLCTLYALHTIEAERGWYQEHGKLTAARSKAVIKTVNALCTELREDAGLLVDAFGVPDACLAEGGDARRQIRVVAPLAADTDLEAAA
jgi:acyl-CoA oxidase